MDLIGGPSLPSSWSWPLAFLLVIVSIAVLSFSSPETSPTPTPVVESSAKEGPTPTAVVPTTTLPPAIETQATTETTEITATVAITPTALPSATPLPTATPWPFDVHSEWERYIYVDQSQQHMYVFEHGNLIRDIPCSTGLPDGDKYTPAWQGRVGEYWGTFFAFDVYADEAWYLYKSAGSILVHSLPYTRTEVSEEKHYLDRDALGQRPASHGCVRISPEDALWFTQWEPKGCPITVSDPYRDKWRNLLDR